MPPSAGGIVDLDDAVAQPVQMARPTLHTIVLEQRDGAQVYRIRAHANGDEMIVDAVTGRLLAVRDAKGKTTLWPMSPMNGVESPQKSS